MRSIETLLVGSAYLAPMQYYAHLAAAKQVWVEAKDSYQKQTYRNRCVIAAADGALSLSIPTVKPSTPKCLMCDVRISQHGNWRHLHWNAIQSAYQNSPFFEYYADDFKPFYEHNYTFLYDFNLSLCALICELIDIEPTLLPTQDYYAHNHAVAAGWCDMREEIHPKHATPSTTNSHFNPTPYYQVFQHRHGFLPNLSIIDLLFNMGPESLLVLHDSLV